MSDQGRPTVGANLPSPLPRGYGNVRGSNGDDGSHPSDGRQTPPARYQRTGRRPAGEPAGLTRTEIGTDGGPTMAVTVLPERPVPTRRLLRRVDAWTVFKVSLVFYLLFALILLIAGAIAWSIAVQLHFVRDIERAVRTLADKRSFVLHPLPVLEYAAAALGVLALVGTVLNTVFAVLYNLISDLVGGVQTVEVVREDR